MTPEQPTANSRQDTTKPNAPTKQPRSKRAKAASASANKVLSRFLYRYHVVLFVVVVLGGMAIVVFLLNQTLATASDTGSVNIPTAGTFDQQTIERLNNLTPSTSRNELRLPSGRVNPFSE